MNFNITINAIPRVINMTNIGSADSFFFSILFISLQIFAAYFTIAQYHKSLIMSVTTNKRNKVLKDTRLRIANFLKISRYSPFRFRCEKYDLALHLFALLFCEAFQGSSWPSAPDSPFLIGGVW
jgi:hypothetical protein